MGIGDQHSVPHLLSNNHSGVGLPSAVDHWLMLKLLSCSFRAVGLIECDWLNCGDKSFRVG
jgi:hypothetical protein